MASLGTVDEVVNPTVLSYDLNHNAGTGVPYGSGFTTEIITIGGITPKRFVRVAGAAVPIA